MSRVSPECPRSPARPTVIRVRGDAIADRAPLPTPGRAKVLDHSPGDRRRARTGRCPAGRARSEPDLRPEIDPAPGRTRPATHRAATCEDHHERPALRRHCVDRVPGCHRLHPGDDTDVGHRQPAPREAAPPTTARPTRLATRAHPRRLARPIRRPTSHSGIPTHRAHVRGLILRSGMPGPARTTQAPHHAGLRHPPVATPSVNLPHSQIGVGAAAWCGDPRGQGIRLSERGRRASYVSARFHASAGR
jgi:hypothetical protein